MKGFNEETGIEDTGGTGNIELTTVVQIDEREIARSVRNQRLEGLPRDNS